MTGSAGAGRPSRACLIAIAALSLGAWLPACDSGSGGTTTPVGDATGGGDGARVVINEVAPTGQPEDWVELYNAGDGEATLTGWTLTDSDPTHVYAFEAGTTLAPGAYHLLVRDEPGSFAFGLGLVDSVTVYAASGAVVDTLAWTEGDAPAGATYGRIPDGGGAALTLYSPSPAGPNAAGEVPDCGNGAIEATETCDGAATAGLSCTGLGFESGTLGCAPDCQAFAYGPCVPFASTVVINEVSSALDDTIELYNQGAAAVDLGGWQLADRSPDRVDGAHVFAAGTSLAPGAFVALRRDIDHTLRLGDDDLVVLRDADGRVVDLADWPAEHATGSYCRLPDGTGSFTICAGPTFGEANLP